MDYESFLATDIHHRITSPTCEDLGIPRELGRHDFLNPDAESDRSKANCREHVIYKIQELKFDLNNPSNPFSPYCEIPLPSPYGLYDYAFEPAFIRKRNERERERVKCVNDGYARLRDHIPIENKEKRISKVETLRAAIRYIKHLQSLLSDLDAQTGPDTTKDNEDEDVADHNKTTDSLSKLLRVKRERDENDEPCTKRRKTRGAEK